MTFITWPTVELIGVNVGIVLIILLTVGGNLFVLFAFYNDPHLLTPSNHFLLSMAIADLLVGLIAIPFYSFAQLKGYWPFGDFFCKVWLTIDDVATMASVLSIVAITIERYWSINHSVHYRRFTTKTRIRIFSILIWLIPFLNFAPGIWFLKSGDESKGNANTTTNHTECIGAYHSHTVYLIIAQINFFAWPLVVIIILNALIVLNLYRRSQRFPSLFSSNDLRRQQMMSGRESKDRKFEDLQGELLPNQENIDLVTPTPRASNSTKRIEIQCPHEAEHCLSSVGIRETDDTSELPVRRLTLSEEAGSRRSSSTTIYKRFKHVFSGRNSASRRNGRNSARSSIFAWRNSSVFFSSSSSSALQTGNGEQRNVRRLRRDKRAATSLLTLVLVFMIFLLPYVFVVVVGRILSLEILTDTNGQIYSAAFWLLWLNSTINPILYPFIQPKFRDAYRKLFYRLVQRRQRLVSLLVDLRNDK